MQNTPFNGAGRRPAPHPFLAILPSPKAIYIHTYLSALYRMRICYVLWEYVNMKGSRSTCTGCVGGPGRLSPPPPLRCRSRGGGGGGLAGWVLPGILSREGGIYGLWVRRVSFACGYGKSIWQVYTASLYGKSIRQLYMAGLFGGSNGLIHSKIWKQENIVKQNEIERNEMYYGESVNCYIIM